MPGKIKVKVLAGRNLPVMDRASDTTDAFVEVKFGGVTHKTDVCRKSLNPHWNSTEWYRFEVDESELQDEPLQLRLMDHDTYSANDAIGKVVISLAPLLAREANNAKGTAAPHGGVVMSGWIPVFDTMHGIRGELNVIVKVELFSDFNKYKTSSIGVQFFHCPMVPLGYRVTAIHGFVEELVVNDDPEYQWIDKIRTPRASNEARQVAFIKLSNQVQRLVGLKAAELGANAVVGYQQDFDLEGEAGVVARAIGTAVSITPLPLPSQAINIPLCTQQQLKNYLDILATDDESTTDLNTYFQTHTDELQKLISILNPKQSSLDDPDNADVDDDDKIMDLKRQSSLKSYVGSVSLYQDQYVSQKSLKHISEDQTELNKLLSRNDEGDSDSSGPLINMKKLKSHFFSKKSTRSRKSDKSDDQISLKSNSSDTSRISMVDIKNEIKKLKRLKKPTFMKATANKEDEGMGMVSILARSVIHAHTSLACISESQDSEHSPSSTMRRTSESEPTINMADEDLIRKSSPIRNNEAKKNVPEIRFTSLHNINVEETEVKRERKTSESCPTSPIAARSENLLKLPGEMGYFGSVSSALSGDSSEIYSSSDEDDESSEFRTDTEKSIETTSSIVQSVLNQDVDPNVVAEIERKLSSLETAGSDHTESKHDNIEYDVVQEAKTESETSTSVQSDETRNCENDENKTEEMTANNDASTSEQKQMEKLVVTKSNSHHFKFHNPFSHKKVSQSFSAPSSPIEKGSFVYRSSKRIKNQLSKISKTSMMKSLSHYSLLPKKKHVETRKASLSQPSSASDVLSKAPSETVLGSTFLSYADLLSLDRGELTAHPIHKSDEFSHPKVSMYIGSEPVSRASLSGHLPYDKEDYYHEHHPHKKEKPAIKPTGLIHTAMETILIDKVQSLLIPATPDPVTPAKQFFDDVNEKLEKVEEIRNKEQIENTKSNESTAPKIVGTIEKEKKERKLFRQDSIHSVGDKDDSSRKMSNELDSNVVIPCDVTKAPVLQHFHPILSGAPNLETIPSLPETSFDHTESIDVEGVEDVNYSVTNSASVCDNSHAACRFDRSEREKDKCDKDKGSPRHARHESYGGREPVVTAHAQNSSLNSSSTPLGIHRRSSDSDLSITPKGGSLNTSVGNTGSGGGAILRPSMNSNNLEMLEYPFLTMTEYPPGFIVHIGGTVCARSVKLVDAGGESAARAAWWAELRTELRAHARALRCNAVIAYTDTAAIYEDVCVLSASGTAAVINLDCDFNADIDSQVSVTNGTKNPVEESELETCSIAHVPYSPGSGPYRAELSTCGGCRRARVPAVLLATCAKPARLTSYAKAVTLTAVAARVRRTQPTAEPGARDISDQLPFLEYELHKLLLAKLRMQGANALFSLQTQIAIGERCVMALASGTAVRLAALPPPTPPRIKASENDKDALDIQRALWDTFNANRIANGYDVGVPDHSANGVLPEVEGEDPPALDLCADKDACVLELDEAEDVETAKSLATRRMHSRTQVLSSALRPAPKAPQAFSQVWRARLVLSGQGGAASTAAERHVARALDGVTYKLRRLQPYAMVAPRFQLELPDDEIQLVVSGAAIPLLDPSKPEHNGVTESNGHGQIGQTGQSGQNHGHGTGDADDEIFTLDEEQLVKEKSEVVEDKSTGQVVATSPTPLSVCLTPLSQVSGARITRRICALRLLFVRETTAVRELGGLSGFLHTTTCEVMAIVRAYTAALGGNALTSFYITQLMLQDNAHKNQGQCLLSVGGDVVHITY